MARFSFEVCRLDQIGELVDYIDQHWARNHVLVTSRELLDWQHKAEDQYILLWRATTDRARCGVGLHSDILLFRGLKDESESGSPSGR